jgi:hypothetical protein
MISADTVTQTWQSMAQTSLSDVPDLMAGMRDRQPVVLAYLLSADGLDFDRNELERILYIGMVVWQIMRQGEGRLLKVTRKRIIQAEEANYDFLERIEAASEEDLVQLTEEMMQDYPEPHVLRYILEAIMEEEEDPEGTPMREDYKGLAFVYLKTVLDAFIAAARPGR